MIPTKLTTHSITAAAVHHTTFPAFAHSEDEQKHTIKAAYCDDDVLQNSVPEDLVPEDLAENHSSSSTPVQPSLQHDPTQLSPFILASALSLDSVL